MLRNCQVFFFNLFNITVFLKALRHNHKYDRIFTHTEKKVSEKYVISFFLRGPPVAVVALKLQNCITSLQSAMNAFRFPYINSEGLFLLFFFFSHSGGMVARLGRG